MRVLICSLWSVWYSDMTRWKWKQYIFQDNKFVTTLPGVQQNGEGEADAPHPTSKKQTQLQLVDPPPLPLAEFNYIFAVIHFILHLYVGVKNHTPYTFFRRCVNPSPPNVCITRFLRNPLWDSSYYQEGNK